MARLSSVCRISLMPETIIRVLNNEVGIAWTTRSNRYSKRKPSISYLESLREGPPTLCVIHLTLHLGDLSRQQAPTSIYSTWCNVFIVFLLKILLSLSNAPYGNVSCDSKDCTLCMSCGRVSDTCNFHTDGASPSLKFVEQDCIHRLVWKGTSWKCSDSTPRMNWVKEERQKAVVIHVL